MKDALKHFYWYGYAAAFVLCAGSMSASGKTIAIPDIPILLGCAFGSWGVVVGEVAAELLYK